MESLRAVVFDWRGTLVTTLEPVDWVRAALRRVGRDDDPDTAAELSRRIDAADGRPSRLEAPDTDTDAARHREIYMEVLADARVDHELAEALYAVESDPAHNPFAEDAAPVLRAIAAGGYRIGLLSDIHFDLRPVFAAVGLADAVTAYVLSYEHGVQKPNPAIFRLALDALGTRAAETLMVGDRASHDGPALDIGMPTLLLPPLAGVEHRRLHLVEALIGARAA
jgi:HAD superfamily hydrolase (TIGR01549 family)